MSISLVTVLVMVLVASVVVTGLGVMKSVVWPGAGVAVSVSVRSGSRVVTVTVTGLPVTVVVMIETGNVVSTSVVVAGPVLEAVTTTVVVGLAVSQVTGRRDCDINDRPSSCGLCRGSMRVYVFGTCLRNHIAQEGLNGYWKTRDAARRASGQSRSGGLRTGQARCDCGS